MTRVPKYVFTLALPLLAAAGGVAWLVGGGSGQGATSVVYETVEPVNRKQRVARIQAGVAVTPPQPIWQDRLARPERGQAVRQPLQMVHLLVNFGVAPP